MNFRYLGLQVKRRGNVVVHVCSMKHTDTRGTSQHVMCVVFVVLYDATSRFLFMKAAWKIKNLWHSSFNFLKLMRRITDSWARPTLCAIMALDLTLARSGIWPRHAINTAIATSQTLLRVFL
jgi:hypothetical protein